MRIGQYRVTLRKTFIKLYVQHPINNNKEFNQIVKKVLRYLTEEGFLEGARCQPETVFVFRGYRPIGKVDLI